MRVRRVTALVLGTLIAAAAAAPAEGAKHKPQPSCAKKGSKTLLRSHDARVFTARGQSAGGDPSTVLYGCLTSAGRKIELSERFDDGYYVSETFSSVRLAGRYVAWHATTTDSACSKYAQCPPGYQPTRSTLHVYDLKRRRSVRVISGQVRDPGVVLVRNGGVAWLSPATSGSQLNAADSTGQRVLDAGAIAPGSLHAEISIISWVRDGIERFARLR